MFNFLFFSLLWSLNSVFPAVEKSNPTRTLESIEIHLIAQADTISENILTIPFRLNGGLILVEAEIDSLKGVFILDSGAPDLVLNSRYNKCKKLNNTSAGGFGGAIASVGVKRLERFKWNTYTLREYQAECINLEQVEKARNEQILGLIGFKIFENFEILLDYDARKVLLYRLDKKGERLAKNGLPSPDFVTNISIESSVVVLKAFVGKSRIRFGIDTGAETNLIDIRLKKKFINSFKINSRAVLTGASKQKIEVLVGYLEGFTVGSLPYPKIKMILSNLKMMNKAYGVYLQGILGYHFLSYRKTAFNFKKRQMFIWEKEKKIISTTESKK